VRPEYTPVEIDTFVTRLPNVARIKVSIAEKLRFGGMRDRVWSLKQEAPRLQLRSSSPIPKRIHQNEEDQRLEHYHNREVESTTEASLPLLRMTSLDRAL